MLKRILLTASVLIFAVGLISNAAPAAEKKIKVKGDSELEKLKNTKAVIETKYGNIEIRFFPDAAPNHVKNFMKLSKEGVYDGTIFHRVIPGFMIQGGDPNTKGPNKAAYGMGGPGYNVNAEFNKISRLNIP